MLMSEAPEEMSLFSGLVWLKYGLACSLKAVVGYDAWRCFLSAVREVSGSLEARSVLALGGGGLLIEASGNFEKF
jgi:hypothetical protein